MSSFLIAAPEALASASADLSGIGEAIRSATSAAAPSTTSVVAAAQDEISAAISKLFGGYGQEFQALSAQAGLFHGSFVQALTSGRNAYAAAEAANASPLQAVMQTAQAMDPFSPVLALTGRPLFGNGANGVAGHRGRPAVAAGGSSAMAAMVGRARTGRPVGLAGAHS